MSEAAFAPSPPSAEALANWAAAEAEAERELAEQDAARDAAEEALRVSGKPPAQLIAAVAPQRAPVRASARVPFYTAVLFACAGWGAVGSIAIISARRSAVPPPENAPVAGSSPAPTARIDAPIRAGRFADGLRECLDTPKRSPGVPAPALAFREGLCLEGLGNWSEAANAYRNAEADPNMAGWARAVLGQTRCALALDRYLLARTLANRVLLRSGHPDCRGLPVCEEALPLRARTARLALGATSARDTLDERTVAVRLSVSRYLDWVPAEHKPTASSPAATQDVLEVHRTLNSPGELRITAHLTARSAIEVLHLIGATAGWKVQAGEAIVTRLTFPIGPLDVDHLPLPELLCVLTEGAGVAWVIQTDTLLLTPITPQEKPR